MYRAAFVILALFVPCSRVVKILKRPESSLTIWF